MDKQNVVHPYNKSLLSNKKEQTTKSHNNMDESQSVSIMLSERSRSYHHSIWESRKGKKIAH